MSEYRWVIAHFSPTGTTLKVARAIAESSRCPAREIDLSAPVHAETLGADEVLLAAVPVYGGRVPALALERLSALKGSGQKAVAAVVYGNRAFDNALLELKDALEVNGLQVIAAGAFVAEHSMARSIAAGRPDANDLATANQLGVRAMQKLAEEGSETVQVPGNPGYREKAAGGLPGHPAGGKGCVCCGLCAEKCPAGAIDSNAPAKTDGKKCLCCMRCVSVCPQKARKLPAPMALAVEGMLKVAASTPKHPELFL